MAKRLSVEEYFRGAETTLPRELVWGVLREPPSPGWDHQAIVTHLGALLDQHVRSQKLGHIVVSPIDVVLDEKHALVVQPDVAFITNRRIRNVVVGNRVRGGVPDLVVEVLSPGRTRHDREVKLRWYRRYGVREYWVVDPIAREVTVVNLRTRSRDDQRVSGPDDVIRSRVLPTLSLPVDRVFEYAVSAEKAADRRRHVEAE